MNGLLGRGRSGSRERGQDNTGERGQSLVELAIALPVVMLLLLGMLEFGFAFSHHLTLEYATREGARTGAALANGSPTVSCSGPDNVDAYVIAAVQRVITSPGSRVPVSQIQEIRIYRANSTGQDTGTSNRWVPGAGPTVDGAALQFARSGSTVWNPCLRQNSSGNVDSIGVSLVYRYGYVTPLGNFLGLGSAPSLTISDRTVMALNPGVQ